MTTATISEADFWIWGCMALSVGDFIGWMARTDWPNIRANRTFHRNRWDSRR
jgi:hypothetical protein